MPADPGGAVARTLRRAARLPEPHDHPDGPLLDRFRRAGDEAAFAELVARHGPMVLGVCRRVTANHADADDAFQAAFLVLVRRAGELTGRAAVGDFLYGVACRTALKARATAVTRRQKEARAAKPEAAPQAADDPDWRPAFDRELAKLPEKYRAAVVLCELEGRPRKDVAGLLGIPEGTLSSRLAAGRKLLADRLKRSGVAVPAGALTASAAVVPPALAESTVRLAAVAAGHAAGAVPASASALASEVTRAMFLLKLRAGVLVAAAGLVATAAGLAGLTYAAGDAPVRAARPADGVTAKQLIDKERAATDALKGTWELQSKTVDGTTLKLGEKKVIDGQEHHLQLEYYRLTFGDRTVKVEWKSSGPGGETHESEAGVTVNPTTAPAHINMYRSVGLVLGLYRLDGDTLEVAMHGISELERPRGFDPADKRIADLPLIVDVYKRVRKDDPKPKDEAKPNPREPAVPPLGDREGDDVIGPPAAGEPGWVAPFRKAYALPEGRSIGFVPGASFGDARDRFVARAGFPGPEVPDRGPPGDYLFAFLTDGQRTARWFTARAGDTAAGKRAGQPLWLHAEGLQLRPWVHLAGDDDLWATRVYADPVVRAGATLTDLARDLPAALKAVGVSATATARAEEREVVVARGEFAPTVGPDGWIDFTPGPADAADLTSSGSTAPMFLFDRLGQVVGRPVVSEATAGPSRVWHPGRAAGYRYVRRSDDDRRPKDLSADRDAVLKHVAAQTGLTFTTEKRTVWVLTLRKAAADAPPAPKPAVDDRPAWRKEFDRVYALKDGELVKRVAPPYPDSRLEFWKDYHQGNPRTIADCPTYFTAFRFKDGRVVGGPVQTPIKPEDGVSLSDLLGMLDFPAQSVEGNDDLLATKVTGDFVLRAGADPKAVAAALSQVLQDAAVPARLTVRDEEREVIVLRGKWASKPLDGKAQNHVELYSRTLIEGSGAGGGSGPFPTFVRRVQEFVNQRVVSEVEEAPKGEVSWRNNVRSPMVKNPATGEDTYAEDTAAGPVLQNVCAQTGLTFAVEKRKVPVLVVERVAGK